MKQPQRDAAEARPVVMWQVSWDVDAPIEMERGGDSVPVRLSCERWAREPAVPLPRSSAAAPRTCRRCGGRGMGEVAGRPAAAAAVDMGVATGPEEASGPAEMQ